MYIYIYTHVCVHGYIYVCIYIYTHTYIHLSIDLFLSLSLYIYTYIYVLCGLSPRRPHQPHVQAGAGAAGGPKAQNIMNYTVAGRHRKLIRITTM